MSILTAISHVLVVSGSVTGKSVELFHPLLVSFKTLLKKYKREWHSKSYLAGTKAAERLSNSEKVTQAQI